MKVLTNEDVIREVILDCKIKVKYANTDIIRSVSKHPKAKLWFSASKATKTPLFEGPTSSWNVLQLRLVYWLTFYSNIEGAYERPPDRVLKNDNLLDKWVESKAEEINDRFESEWAKGGSSKVAKSASDQDEVWSLE